MKIKGCTALVTGGNRGIGQGFVQELVDAGTKKVYVAARKLSDAKAACEGAEDILYPIQLDVTKQDEIDAAADACTDLTVLVNNAGAFHRETLLGASDMSAMRSEIETNYIGVVAMCRAFAPILKANGGGAIVNVLSAGGIIAVPGMGGYSPSKFAARAASDCMRAELAPQNTQVHALIVGSVDTRMAKHVTWQEKSTPRDIGKAGIQAIEHNIPEHDTDPHSVSVRAFLARDPHTIKQSMAKALHSGRT
jgi:NAD(P)-dependent dehydrogenase (short-subunit alcohol dehydrogenase family)